MNTFRIRHKPTGLFYQPVKEGKNLHKSGKFYHKKPTLKSISHGYHDATKGSHSYRKGEFKKFHEEEWEIIEYETTIKNETVIQALRSLFTQHHGNKNNWCGIYTNCSTCGSLFAFSGNWESKDEKDCPFCKAQNILEKNK